MTGVTFDMTFAPSADSPSRLRRSKIEPGQSVIGYSLTAFVAPPIWDDGHAAPGQYRVTQPSVWASAKTSSWTHRLSPEASI